jgi:hypothetical protein
VGRFICSRPSSTPTSAHSHVRSQPVTARAPQSLTSGTRLSALVSLITSPAPADPHRQHNSGQIAMRAFGQGCLMPPRPILSLLADDWGLYRHLTSAASSPSHSPAVLSLHGRDADAKSSTARPHATHPANGVGAAEGCHLNPSVALPARMCSHVARV